MKTRKRKPGRIQRQLEANELYRRVFNNCRKRLCALKPGKTINAEEWYGQGWGTAEHCIKELAEIAKPLFRIDRVGDLMQPMIATKIR